jgi:hypothetical protein
MLINYPNLIDSKHGSPGAVLPFNFAANKECPNFGTADSHNGSHGNESYAKSLIQEPDSLTCLRDKT